MRLSKCRLLLSLLALLIAALLITPITLPAADASSRTPEQIVRRAWQAAHDVGVYHFTSDVVQTSYPAPALNDVGRSSTRNGLHDEVTVANSATLHPSSFTVGAWVMPTAVRTGATQEIGVRSSSDAAGTFGPQPTWLANYRLYIAPDGLTPVAEFSAGCSEYIARATSVVSLVKDQWDHVMATYDRTRLSLYVNGAEQGHWLSTDEGCPSIHPCLPDP